MKRLLVLLALCASVAFSGVPNPVPMPVPVAVPQAILGPSTGISFYGLDFDGTDDYCVVTQAASDGVFDFGTASFTIEAWIKSSSLTGSNFIAGKGNISADESFLLWTDGVALRVSIGSGGTVKGAEGGTLVINTWQRVALVVNRSANTIQGFINGAAAGGTTDITGLGTQTGTEDAWFGRGKYGGTAYFDGEICQMRVWKGTAKTTWTDYDRPWLDTPTAAWAFQPGSGQSLTSYTGGPSLQLGSDALPAGDANDPTWQDRKTRLTAEGPQ